MLKKLCDLFCCDETKPEKPGGVVGYFKDEDDLLEAAKATFSAGYRSFDTISPFPIHGMDDAMGLKRSIVPWFTFFAGLTGCVFATWFQWWTSAVDYPVNIAGKPFFSLPAFVPIIFEITVLFAGLASFGAVLLLCRLPKIDPPILNTELTCHKFALYISENDPKYNSDQAKKHLEGLKSSDVEFYKNF